eukprot:GILI01026510.1.p1 GENE.GILI01026510.1~~GILI01026510.1.p1  ORF type:complete len:321 (-),score=25.75 GILI01026510.1:103-1005(-)
MVSDAWVYPMKRVLTIMTIKGELKRIGGGETKGYLDTITTILKHEGVLGFMRGFGVHFVFRFPRFISTAIAEGLSDIAIEGIVSKMDPQACTPLKETCLALLHSTLQSLLSIPTVGVCDTLFTHLAADVRVDGRPYRYNGPRDCMMRLIRGGGIKSFYQGCLLNTASTLVYNLTQQAVFSAAAQLFSPEQMGRLRIPITLTAIVACAFVTQPIATVQLRMQLAAKSAASRTAKADEVPMDGAEEGNNGAVLDKQYNGIADCVRTVVREGGLSALWDGFGGSMLSVSFGLGMHLTSLLYNR